MFAQAVFTVFLLAASQSQDPLQTANCTSEVGAVFRKALGSSVEDCDRGNGSRPLIHPMAEVNSTQIRSKRHGYHNQQQEKQQTNFQVKCVSQCVFNKNSVVDEFGYPSESAMTEWIKGCAPNEQKKKAAIRQLRKCFGSINESEATEAICSLTKALSTCLDFGFEDYFYEIDVRPMLYATTTTKN